VFTVVEPKYFDLLSFTCSYVAKWPSSGLSRRAVWYKFTDVSEVLAVTIIAVIGEAVSTSETTVNLYQTARCNKPRDKHLHTLHRENQKSHPDIGHLRQ
jgi:hypothetical protein